MLAMFGHTWASQYGTQPTGTAADTWSAALAGLSGQHIADGLTACVSEGLEFPPSAPRFRAMCLGIPTFARVRAEIVTTVDETRSAFARLVWSHVLNPFAYRQASTKEADRMLQDAYELAHDARMRGCPLPLPCEGRLEHAPPRRPVPATPEQTARHLADIRAELGLSESEAEAMGAEGLEKAGER